MENRSLPNTREYGFASVTSRLARWFDLAAADDGVTRGYLAAGGTVGVEHVGYLGANLDGGVRIAQTPVFAHAQLSTGVASTGFMTDGRYSSFRAGPEGPLGR